MATSGFTQKDAEAFSVKLEAWSKTLDAKERALLHVLLKSGEAGAPGGAQLSDQQLEAVAGGGAPPLQLRTFNLLSKYVGFDPIQEIAGRKT